MQSPTSLRVTIGRGVRRADGRTKLSNVRLGECVVGYGLVATRNVRGGVSLMGMKTTKKVSMRSGDFDRDRVSMNGEADSNSS